VRNELDESVLAERAYELARAGSTWSASFRDGSVPRTLTNRGLDATPSRDGGTLRAAVVVASLDHELDGSELGLAGAKIAISGWKHRGQPKCACPQSFHPGQDAHGVAAVDGEPEAELGKLDAEC
jgi:hypothetical protein